MQTNTRKDLPQIPVILHIGHVAIDLESHATAARLGLIAELPNGTRPTFAGGERDTPIHINIDKHTLTSKFFAERLTRGMLRELLIQYYLHELSQRAFRITPYFTTRRPRLCNLDLWSDNPIDGLSVEIRSNGVIDWRQLYPIDSPEMVAIRSMTKGTATRADTIQRMKHVRSAQRQRTNPMGRN